MPRLIDAGSGGAFDLAELIATLDATRFDVRDEDSFASLGPLLARLGRNPDFLAELAIEELKTRAARQNAASNYGPQVLLLRPPGGGYALRANFWPAADDAVLRTSGAAAFQYAMPHDHNFPFLTWGYCGPGYWSDYYEIDGDAAGSVDGAGAGLRFTGRARLATGTLMLYRTGRDVHVQHPPDRFSVSLNILGVDPAQLWIDQYRFDIATDRAVAGLTVAASEALLMLAVRLGNGVDLAAEFARAHPCTRMRITALDALAGEGCGAALLERATGSADALVAGHARRLLSARAEFAP